MAANSKAWMQSADASASSTYQATATGPDLCHGGPIVVRGGGSFAAVIGSQ